MGCGGGVTVTVPPTTLVAGACGDSMESPGGIGIRPVTLLTGVTAVVAPSLSAVSPPAAGVPSSNEGGKRAPAAAGPELEPVKDDDIPGNNGGVLGGSAVTIVGGGGGGGGGPTAEVLGIVVAVVGGERR